MVKICIANSVKAKTEILSKNEFYRIIDSLTVKAICEEIKEETDDKKKALLKKKLQIICWNASFKNGRRVSADAIPSGLIMLDIDHFDNPRELFERIKERAINEFGLVCAHISCSG